MFLEGTLALAIKKYRNIVDSRRFIPLASEKEFKSVFDVVLSGLLDNLSEAVNIQVDLNDYHNDEKCTFIQVDAKKINVATDILKLLIIMKHFINQPVYADEVLHEIFELAAKPDIKIVSGSADFDDHKARKRFETFIGNLFVLLCEDSSLEGDAKRFYKNLTVARLQDVLFEAAPRASHEEMYIKSYRGLLLNISDVGEAVAQVIKRLDSYYPEPDTIEGISRKTFVLEKLGWKNSTVQQCAAKLHQRILEACKQNDKEAAFKNVQYFWILLSECKFVAPDEFCATLFIFPSECESFLKIADVLDECLQTVSESFTLERENAQTLNEINKELCIWVQKLVKAINTNYIHFERDLNNRNCRSSNKILTKIVISLSTCSTDIYQSIKHEMNLDLVKPIGENKSVSDFIAKSIEKATAKKIETENKPSDYSDSAVPDQKDDIDHTVIAMETTDSEASETFKDWEVSKVSVWALIMAIISTVSAIFCIKIFYDSTKLSTWAHFHIKQLAGPLRLFLMNTSSFQVSRNEKYQEPELEQVLTSEPIIFEEKDDFLLINRLGSLTADTSTLKLLHVLRSKLNDLLNRIYDTFFVNNNEIVMMDSVGNREDILKQLCKEILAVYFIAKLASLKCSSMEGGDHFYHGFTLLVNLFESLLKLFSSKGADTVSKEEFELILSIGFLTTALAQFIGDSACNRTEQALALLISLAYLQKIVETFKEIIPPAYQSRLFTLTLYHDLQKIEAHMDTGDLEQTAKLKGIMEIVLIRYGDFFLNYYADEILIIFNESELVDCSSALWRKATHGGAMIKTELGPSFLVSMIKYQWGITKDFNGIVPDPLIDVILYHTELENLFEFLSNQGQQLFLLVGALYTVLNEDPSYQSTFVMDAEILTRIFIELMDHLSRLITALDSFYTVTVQTTSTAFSNEDKMKMLQYTKFYILIHSLSLCLMQMSLTGPLNISTTPSLSPVIEHYLSKSDFSAAIKDQFLTVEFQREFKNNAVILCTNYSMIKRLSYSVLESLEGRDDIPNALNSGMSWNMLSFTILVCVAFSILFVWFIQVFISYLEDHFII